MFQIMTQESIEPVAMRGAGTGETRWCFVADHRNIHQRKLNKKRFVIVTNLFHVVADVHTCHTVPVALEMSF